MTVSFSLAVQRSWARMVRMLFRPFRLGAWLTLGFAAFLSEYRFHFGGRHGVHHDHGHWNGEGMGMGHVVRSIAAFLLHPVWGAIAISILTLALIAVVVLLWLSSRMKFVFLDDVANERPAIVTPWTRWARQGNSLFAWWLVFSMVVIVGLIVVFLPVIPVLLAAVANSDYKMLAIASLVGWALLMAPIALVIGFVLLFLFQFVVPIMAAQNLGVMAGWRQFFSLFGRNPGAFLVYGLLFIVIRIAEFFAIATLGLSTCCVGFVLLAIPYVGSVILLPAEVFLRGLGPDFLAQFGPEWSVFPAAPASAPPAAPPPAPQAPLAS